MRGHALLIVHNYGLQHNRVRMELDAIADAGLSGDLICLRAPGEPARERYRTIDIHRLPVERHRGARLPVYLAEYGTFFTLATLRAGVLAFRKRPAIVFVHSLPDVLVFAALVPKLLGAHVVLNLREFTPELVMTRYGTSERNWLVRLSLLLERWSCRFADTVVTVHDTGARLLAGRSAPRDSLMVVTNSIELPAGETGAQQRSASPRSGPFTLLYHGTAGNEYDLRTVIDALAVLRARGLSAADVRLRIVGSGPALPDVRARVSELELPDWVSIEPPVPFEMVPTLLNEADAAVPLLSETPYAHLGIPTKLLECAAAGVPILSVKGAAIGDYFPDDSLQYVPFGDAVFLATAIERLMTDPELRSSHAEKARAALEPILPGVMRARYAKLLESVVGARESGNGRSG